MSKKLAETHHRDLLEYVLQSYPAATTLLLQILYQFGTVRRLEDALLQQIVDVRQTDWTPVDR